MPTLLEALQSEADVIRRITAYASRTECPDFIDLWWDNVDLDTGTPRGILQSPSCTTAVFQCR